ncbi:M13 family metallopeptidase [Sandaracinobacter sp. RS1-74]|uniref:M13 family metallopeptidase n=1 Tax=Sandaracinobacteroides sayramensis TaxID=2913411 RepID=UPI001EDB5D63|nr:M13 family metallopeptidase [Sandaracinobacteroides sayramensis]MCG2841033.1 M13 family metallopeptidase [Sandaracinobacteroides sayramensis]
MMEVFVNKILLAALAAVSFSAVSAVSHAQTYGSFGLDTAGMDRSVKPGDDFYRFANGTWEKTTEIPADRSNYGMFTVLDDLSKERTKSILDELKGNPQSLAGRSYASYLDQPAVEAKGLAPIQPWLAEVRKVEKAGYPALVAKAQQAGIRTPFPNYVNQDDKDPETYIVNMMQGGLGMPDRDYYLLDSEKMQKTRAAYLKHLATMLEFAGEKNAPARAKAIVDFETAIAKDHWNRVDSRDADKTYNKRTLAELQKEAAGFDFQPLLTAGGKTTQTLLVAQPSAVAATARAIGAAPIGVLRDQMIVRSLEAYADYLPDAVANANFAFYGTELQGTPERQERWKRAVDFTVGAVPDDVSQVYVARYFPPETKAAMDELVKNVLAAMGRRIDGLPWMAAETKAKAQTKLQSFTTKIGYPDRWKDYAGLEIRADDLFGNAWRSNQFDFAYDRGKLGTPVRRWEWFMTPMTINAYANFGMNEIVFPAAILQPPFFDPKADPAINYGAIGAVIGHEISHHFDDQGSKYDATGKLTTWWTEQDLANFKALGEKLVKQYDAYEPMPGEHVKGALTLGENIGDLAGLAVALDAYHASLGGKPAPVLDGLTGDQRFFLGWAQAWRRNVREAAARQRLLTDPHAPDQYRADIVRNFDQWYEAFKPAADGKLVLKPDERVKIW